MSKRVPISTLKPGQKFILHLEDDLPSAKPIAGHLIEKNSCSVLVRLESGSDTNWGTSTEVEAIEKFEEATPRKKREKKHREREQQGIRPRGKSAKSLENFDSLIETVKSSEKETEDVNSKEAEVPPQTQETSNMATSKVTPEGSTKLLGYFRGGKTAMAYLISRVEDEKVHRLAPILAELKSKFKVDPMYRVQRLRQEGVERKAWAVLVDKDAGTIQLRTDKAAITKLASNGRKPSNGKKTNAKSNGKKGRTKKSAFPETGAQASEKAQKAAAVLIRRTLSAGGDDWTRNKMVEKLKRDGIEPKVTLEALTAEIKKNGITEENGLLSLV